MMFKRPEHMTCVVKSKRLLAPDVFELVCEAEALEYSPGQYLSVLIPQDGPGPDVRRSYSFSSPPEQPTFALCINRVADGPGTSYMNRLQPGDTFRALGPCGRFVYRPKPGRNICFIATGTGIAPFRSMLLSQHYRDTPPSRAYCFFGVRNAEGILYPELFTRRNSQLDFVAAMSQPTSACEGERGRVTAHLVRLGSDFPWQQTEFYLCGHGGMVADTRAILSSRAVAADSIHQEVYYAAARPPGSSEVSHG